MGPTIILDKSALQAFSAGELTILRKYFLVCHTPIIIAEILADLSKSKDFSSSEDVVKINAKKLEGTGFSTPCVSAKQLIESELLGRFKVPMNGVIPVAEGQTIASKSGTTGVLFGTSTIEAAIGAWKRGEFAVSEHRFANSWRETVRSTNLEKIQRELANHVRGDSVPDSPQELMVLVERILFNPKHQTSLVGVLIEAGTINSAVSKEISSRWHIGGYRDILSFAPYSFHCLRVFLFFSIGLSLKCPFIGTRASNILDLEYFFYAPICNIFVSADNFHRDLAQLFVTRPRMFVWAEDLKADLARIGDLVANMEPGDRRNTAPPDIEGSITYQAWQRYMRIPDEPAKNVLAEMSPQDKDRLTQKLRELYNGYSDCDEASMTEVAGNPDFVIRKTSVNLHETCECGSRRLRKDCCYSEISRRET